MPALTDPVILAQFQKVLAEWNCTGYVIAKEVPGQWIKSSALDMKLIAKAMNDFLAAGGIIDQVKEVRPEWNVWPYHYDFRLTLAGKKIYVETLLDDDDPNDPIIVIVSIHNV